MSEINPEICYCQDEVASSNATGICPVHPVGDEEMRRRIRRMVDEAYKAGRHDALDEISEKIQDLIRITLDSRAVLRERERTGD